MLFNLLAITYKNLWMDALQDDAIEEATAFIWITGLKGFSENLILDAAMECIKTYHFPPSIQQFLEIANQASKNKKMEENADNVLKYQRFSDRSPPSPLLQECMDTHPLKPDDPFKKIFAETAGKERGRAVMQEICRQLRSKHEISK